MQSITTVSIETEVLSDGSEVFNVIIKDDGHRTEMSCYDEKAADDIYASLVKNTCDVIGVS